MIPLGVKYETMSFAWTSTQSKVMRGGIREQFRETSPVLKAERNPKAHQAGACGKLAVQYGLSLMERKMLPWFPCMPLAQAMQQLTCGIVPCHVDMGHQIQVSRCVRE